ncbi:MAG: hypothetical protein RL033_335, partial [Pseudomonadota bacterium]
FCVGNVFFTCVNGVQGGSTNCDEGGLICDPIGNGCSPPCFANFCRTNTTIVECFNGSPNQTFECPNGCSEAGGKGAFCNE